MLVINKDNIYCCVRYVYLFLTLYVEGTFMFYPWLLVCLSICLQKGDLFVPNMKFVPSQASGMDSLIYS